ncbi:hypothetical protein [Micromonospora musae]|uniref:hypothetical protein n=2 Tax=Micromonospora TaxID=1873 RepID=UPI003438B3E3
MDPFSPMLIGRIHTGRRRVRRGACCLIRLRRGVPGSWHTRLRGERSIAGTGANALRSSRGGSSPGRRIASSKHLANLLAVAARAEGRVEMDQAITALAAVIAVLSGAAGTYVVGRLTDRDRFARELQVRWDQRRLDAYVSYVSAAKLAGTRANQVHAGRGNGASEADLDALLRELAELELRRSEAFEALPLLADGATIEAAHELNRAVWQLEQPARQGTKLDEETWHALADKWVNALNNFHSNARAGLSVPGQFSRRDVAALTVNRPEPATTSATER